MPVYPMAGVKGYLGPLGALVELPVVSSLTTSEGRPSSEARTLGGARVLTVAPATRRTWSVAVQGARPHEVGALAELLRSSPGPYWWADPYAQVTNLLPPDATTDTTAATSWGNASARGGFATGEGVARSSLAVKNGGVATSPMVPVVPGVPVTASAYLLAPPAGAPVYPLFFDAGGASLPSPTVSTSATTSSSGAARRYATAVPPAGAVSCRIIVNAAVPFAWPCLTWTDGPRHPSAGQGCDMAAVVEWGAEARATYSVAHGPRTAHLTMTVQEVG